jgi:CDP-diacylglycerol--glycerol-3-phosphate 3-phosphatidyltransferase
VALIIIALWDFRFTFLGCYVVLAITDLIDGPLARRSNQSTYAGALLDSIADITLGICLLVGIVILTPSIVLAEWPILLAAFVSYGLVLGITLFRFGRFPAFHTLTSKIAHLLVAVAGVATLLIDAGWPLRVAAAMVLIANLENALIALRLKDWQGDVRSIFTLPRRQY